MSTDVPKSWLSSPDGQSRVDAARLDAIVRSAMDAIITIDREQRIVLFNAAAERVFGCAADEVLGRPLDRFIPERFRTAHRAHIERFALTGETARRMGPQAALCALRADGTEFPMEASISQVTVGDQKLLTVILRDLTDRVQAESRLQRAQDDLREGEARLEAIMRSAMDAIITIDEEQRIVLFNAAAATMFACSAVDALGAPLDRFLPERYRALHRRHVVHFSRTGETARRMGAQTQLWGLRADGTEFPLEASISHANVAGHKLLTVILRDVTERINAEKALRQAHSELREVAVTMQEVREAERTRIARELHDELGQALTALKMDVDLLEATLPAERRDLLERAEAMRELLDSTVITTRRLSADLRPLVLDDLGLGAAAEWLMQNVVQRAGVRGRLDVDPSLASLGEPYASALFRIMQEALTNVTRHACARNVDVELQREGNQAVLTVVDDGIGIDSDAPPKQGSFGLRGITERALMLGGSVRITGQPRVGTTVVARIPLIRPAESARQ
jgi:PAS domain S-box-containing protein